MIRDKIMMVMNQQELLSNKRLPTTAEWDRYFIDTYNNQTAVLWKGKDFLTYEVKEDHIMINDFIASGNGLQMFREVLSLSEEKKLPIRAYVHISNIHILNVLLKRFGFKILEFLDTQYLVERG